MIIKKAPNYAVDENGNIFNIKTGKEITPYVDQLGYCQVILRVNKMPKHYRVHRLMYDAFLNTSKPFVNHIDGDKTNNKLENLETVTNQENVIHAYNIGLYKDKRRSHPVVVDNMRFKSIREASRELCLNRKRLTGILKGFIPNHTKFFNITYSV
ncbi:HNH endonuclease [Veillonella montpellierensis]|uniref:HNH endonuclease n=1 Tax=Veillonella montpellierensis TaxID=187328 RepID=UPI0006907DC3|nr:HNH endonuclease [Veillonella montpellierensis]